MLILGLLALTPSTVSVCPVGFEAAIEPQVAVSQNGVFVAFGMGDLLYVSRSADGAKSYGPPVKVATLSHLMLGMRRGPRIVAVGSRLVLTAVGKTQAAGADELWSWASVDSGETWTAPQRINDVAGSAREGLDGLGSGGGKIVCAWLDGRTKGTKLYASDSTDGIHWTPNRLVYASPSGSVCECCHPSVAVDDQGTASYLFRNSREGNRDMYLARDLRPATKLDTLSWPLAACPMDGGSLILVHGAPYAVWRRDKEIRYSDGKTVKVGGIGQQPVTAMTASGPILAFLVERGGTLRCGAPADQLLGSASAHADDPSLAGLNNGEAVLVWTETGAGIKSLVVQ